jgi:transcriptional regulator with XRE-family HTH domain
MSKNKKKTESSVAIGKNIKKFRNKKGFTQTELGKKIGRALTTVQQYEYGEVTPPIETLNKIAEALEVDLDTLLGLDIRSTEKILEDTKNILDNFKSDRYVKTTPMNSQDVIIAFKGLFLSLGFTGVLNISDEVINKVIFSDEFKDHTFYLIDKYSNLYKKEEEKDD